MMILDGSIEHHILPSEDGMLIYVCSVVNIVVLSAVSPPFHFLPLGLALSTTIPLLKKRL